MTKKRRSAGLKPMTQKEIVELSETYADCFSDNRKSLQWLDAFTESVSNMQKFNKKLLGG